MTATNPSSASPLDVKACVRLLEQLAITFMGNAEAANALAANPMLADRRASYLVEAKEIDATATTLSRLRVFLSEELPGLQADHALVDSLEHSDAIDAITTAEVRTPQHRFDVYRSGSYSPCTTVREALREAIRAARSLPTEPTGPTPNLGVGGSEMGVPAEPTEESKR